jgi:hypothetical protein
MEGGPGNETSQLASSPVSSARNQDSVIASYKELIKEQDEELGKIRGRCGELETNYTQVCIKPRFNDTSSIWSNLWLVYLG